jgi:hypothetical protein
LTVRLTSRTAARVGRVRGGRVRRRGRRAARRGSPVGRGGVRKGASGARAPRGTSGVSRVSETPALSLGSGWSKTSKVALRGSGGLRGGGCERGGGSEVLPPALALNSRRRRLAAASPRSSRLSPSAPGNLRSGLEAAGLSTFGSGLAPGRSSRPCSLEATRHPSAADVAALVWANSAHCAHQVRQRARGTGPACTR